MSAHVAVIAAAVFAVAPIASVTAQTAPRPIRANDLLRLRTVSDPQLSPDGSWVAYTVASIDTAKDKSDSDVWMTSWDGTQSVRLTFTSDNESSPRWSPDGRYLAFLSGRQEGRGAQVWLLDRRGGEAQRITMVKNGVSEVAWSPDGKRLALVAGINSDTVAAKRDTSKAHPIVIDRFQFKQDIDGYLETSYSHVLLFDIASKKLDTLTRGAFDDAAVRWSPDGARLAFIRSTPPEPGLGGDSDLWVIDSRNGATARRLTNTPGPDVGPPAWSPDGAWLAFLRTDEPKFYAYQQPKLALVRSDGSAPMRIVTAALDRSVAAPTFAADGRSVLVTVNDDREHQLARVTLADGGVARLVRGRNIVRAYSAPGTASGKVALLLATSDRPVEIWAFENAAPRQLSHHNDSLMASLVVAPIEELTSKSSDGTEVHSILVRPANAPRGAPLPTIFYIHGGPNSQDNLGFSFDQQFFAANGYAVISVNYRGSDGRGLAFQRAIFADWGNKEVVDILGAADEAVKQGIADPNRLAIGGWSYGGILTDYTIATTQRFKAGVSGAGSALQLSLLGADQYVEQYELELGAPWKSRDLWMKVSYPYFEAPKIKTPTLFLGGQLDYNVPIIGGEQMYQALRMNGVPTQLVVYPNQYHGLTVPSFRVDYRTRFLEWVNRYLKPSGGQ